MAKTKNPIKSQIDQMLKVLRELPSTYSLVALAKYYEGMNKAEICASLCVAETYYDSIEKTLENVARKIAAGTWRGLAEELSVGELIGEGRIYPQPTYYSI